MVAFAGNWTSELAARVQIGGCAVALESWRIDLRLELAVAVPGWDWVSWVAISLRPPPPPSSSFFWWLHRWHSFAEKAPLPDCFAALHMCLQDFGALCSRG